MNLNDKSVKIPGKTYNNNNNNNNNTNNNNDD